MQILKKRNLAVTGVAAAIIVGIFYIISFNGCVLAAPPRTLWMDTLDIEQIFQDWGTPQRNQSVEGNPLTIGKQKFERGIGTHANSRFIIDLKGVALEFQAMVGVDKEVGDAPASVVFQVIVDDEKVFDSGIMGPHTPAKAVKVNVTNADLMELVVTSAGDSINYDHADWAEAKLLLEPKSEVLPVAFVRPREEGEILTPPVPFTPRINSPRVFGVGVDSPFLYYIATTGKRPMKFLADGLPEGLILDRENGSITGMINKKGNFKVKLTATNSLGSDWRELQIVVGGRLALTPPMGWNSWNCWGCSVDDAKIRAAADAMVSSDLINHGWTYINIDDCWHGDRDPETGEIQSNEKFPDMTALCDYVHSKGLKIGLYTDCGPKTCAGYEGSEGHEQQDIFAYAKWGFDYVKIDWCHCEGKDPKTAYQKFGDALKNCPRDIVFSICNWGVKKPWTWGKSVGGNLWRTTGDIVDTWGSISTIGFGQAGLSEFAGPGYWNDPDMLVVGMVGWGPQLHPTRLTPDEQYTHLSLWCLLSAPLLLGCDLTRLDDFTKSLLTNDEVIALDQDPLGSQAERVLKEGDFEVWAKNLADGSKAVGLFNRGFAELEGEIDWESLELEGEQTVRDLWRQQDLGQYKDSFSSTIPSHGVVLVKITATK